jgi:hypothetical protein
MYARVKHNPNFVDTRVNYLSLPAKTLTLAAIVKRDAWSHHSSIIGWK